jgi:hypothetical protein
MTRRIFGLDFSGAKKAGRFIWLAEGEVGGQGLAIASCRPATELPGSGIDRDSALAALRNFIAANPQAIFGCDFPFSLPRQLIRTRTWPGFIALFDHADAEAFRQHCRELSGGREPKRLTDMEARTPWSAFNIRLYHQTYHGLADLLRPLVREDKAAVLPMQRPREDRAWLIETCPASTLALLRCRVPYKNAGQREQRRWIVEQLVRLGCLQPLPAEIQETVVDNNGGDALDSIIAAVATAGALTAIQAGDAGGDRLEGRVYFKP